MNYETRLAELVREPVLAQLKGPGGLLALTGRELWLLDEQGEQYAPLTRIRRITRGEGGTVMILSDTDTLMTVPLRSFEVSELKMFLESLKEHVIRARKGISTAVDNPPAASPSPLPQPTPPDPE
ncbi:YcxB family protein, partial [Meiothermus sp. PNK-Is4]